MALLDTMGHHHSITCAAATSSSLLNFRTVLLYILLTFMTTVTAFEEILKIQQSDPRQDCPIGFVQYCESNSTNCRCDCDPRLFPEFVLRCFISNKTVLRKANVWISYVNTTKQESLITHPHCPSDYCKPFDTYLNLSMPSGSDVQCAFNRTGILCGACIDGFSSSFGSSRCIKCSNSRLSLIIVFAIAGIALVAFLIICNLTVSVGTINGLIFYANIIQANRAIFLPFNTSSIFTIFISWLNLDFGVETCFYDGMDAYLKTWLQFCFPAYIYFLSLMVIILSNYSNSFARLFARRSPVAAQATLILLGYAKILRIAVAVFSFGRLSISVDDIHNADEFSLRFVWLQDGNLPYLSGKHIYLFVTTFVLVVIGLYFTTYLVFWQCLERLNKKILIFCPMLKLRGFSIFMDAYYAPYDRKHRYWTGLLLLLLFLLYLVISTTSFDPLPGVLTISLLTASILLYKLLFRVNIYRNQSIDTLENSFFVNILVFSIATMYITASGGNQVVLGSISVSIALCTFLGILVYHTYTFILRNFTTRQSVRDKLKSCLTVCHPCNIGNCLAVRNFGSRRNAYDIFDRNTPETRPLLANQPQRPLHLVRDD